MRADGSRPGGVVGRHGDQRARGSVRSASGLDKGRGMREGRRDVKRRDTGRDIGGICRNRCGDHLNGCQSREMRSDVRGRRGRSSASGNGGSASGRRATLQGIDCHRHGNGHSNLRSADRRDGRAVGLETAIENGNSDNGAGWR